MKKNLLLSSCIIENLIRDEDSRGSIISLLDVEVKNVSIITSKPGTIRSNHYHLDDWHYMYVLSGNIDYFYKNNQDNKIQYLKVRQGENIFTPPLEWHATYFSEETQLIVSSKNPRDQKTYEADTVREIIITHENISEFLPKLSG